MYVKEEVDRICEKHASDRAGALLNILTEIMDAVGYIPAESLADVAKHVGTSLGVVQKVVERGDSFSTVPVGKHLITLCDGTACHTRGSSELLQAVEFALGIKPGETTPDGRFSLRLVACVGHCEKAPVLIIDDQIMPEQQLADVAKTLMKVD